jgi:hypothetical protein
MNGPGSGTTADGALRRVVQAYGRLALDDPVALRAALRACAPELPEAEVELLVAVGGSGAWEPARRATAAGTDPARAVADAMDAVQGSTALAPADAERACRAFAAALASSGSEPPGAETPAGHRIDWGSEAPPSLAAALPGGPLPGSPPATPPRRGLLLPVAGVAVVMVAALAILLVVIGRDDPQPVPDRYAVDQVALRYRALGATLLDGALRCAPLPPAPGELEKVDCSYGGWSVVLTWYDSGFRLDQARGREVVAQPDAAREAVARDAQASFAMRERSGSRPTLDPATASVYWDAQDPRPVSATISTTELSLPALVRFWDGRGAANLRRPAVPGAEFDSAALWLMAAPFVNVDGVSCGPVPEEQPPYYGAVESVRCRYPNGVTADFNRVGNTEQLQDNRKAFASAEDTAPGSLRLGGWSSDDGELRGQLAEYVLAAQPGPHLYFDQPELLTFAHLFHPELTQDQLKAFWVDTSAS